MKRILLLPLFICTGFLMKAQVYNNEWIDYNKTYYKFKLGATGLYRITQAALISIGLDNTPAENFQLWRNGREIALYTSVPSGILGGSDYIEFWGEMNDGKPDKPLYLESDYQLNDHWSLETDSASYFLTVNSSTPNKRLESTINNVAGNTLSPEPYFMHTIGNYYKNKISAGNAQKVQESYVYSSAYDKGEGYTSPDIAAGNKINPSHGTLRVYNAGPDASFSINAAGNAVNQRSFRVTINGTQIVQQNMDYYDYVKYQTTFPVSVLSTNAALINIINDGTGASDRMVVGQYEMTYPRLFNFDNLKKFYFKLPANTNGNFLQITNFNYSGIPPVLYDLTNSKRYVADVSIPTSIKIALEPSSLDRELVLVSEDNSNISLINSFEAKNFINYGLAANQGDYLIISNSRLFSGSNGGNPVDDYRAYRSSPEGGGYTAKVYDIDQLIDQFAFGIKKHPASIKNFIQYALNNFSSPPRFVFLLGKAVNYVDYRNNEAALDVTVKANLERLDLVPTFGVPASDNLFSCFPTNSTPNTIPTVPIGRLSVISPDEVTLYLNKVKDYEATQAMSSPLIADKGWTKNVIHVIGADDESLQSILAQIMGYYKDVITDTLFGGNVTTFAKTSTNVGEQIKSDQIKTLFDQGLSMILYFGHSSSSTLDFNLDNPSEYNNPGKYPIFIALGCNAGNLYTFNQQRLYTAETISERFVLAPDRGSIAFLATTSLGIVQYLDIFNTNNYRAIAFTKYGKTIGEIMQEAIRRSFDITTQFDFYARVHCEQISLNGDPALKYNAQPKPDYAIEEPLVSISPSFISVAQKSFKLTARMMNLGMAIDHKIVVEVKRTYPNNVTEVIRRDTILGVRYMDSISFDVPIVANRDKGINKITITVDAPNEVDELYETNNSVTKEVVIYDNAASPVYPYDFSIVNRQGIKLVASTANPFAQSMQYNLEMDTTELFNSPFKVSKSLTSKGGVLEFDPGVTFTDSTVYYWRIAPLTPSGTINWSTSSFIYLPNGGTGFNQSHFYQHTKSDEHRLVLDSSSRKWHFDSIMNNLVIRSGVFPSSFTQASGFAITVNDQDYIRSVCGPANVVFNVFDANTFQPWYNGPSGSAGQYGSDPICGPERQWNFQFNIQDTAKRRKIVEFMDLIPDGAYVIVRNCSYYQDVNPYKNTYASTWKGDTSYLGAGNSMYQRLFAQGFTTIDSFYRPRAFVFAYQKNGSFTPKSIFSSGIYDPISLSVNCPSPDSIGYLTSPVFGPAKSWQQIHWRGNTVDTSGGDNPKIDVYGLDQNYNETVLFTGIDQSTQDFDISGVDASTYPYLKLKMQNLDSVHFTPYQLNYWRVNYLPVPEGAIAPNITFQLDTTAEVGQPINFRIAFKNVSDWPFDSLKVSLVITDRNNVPNIVPIPRQRPLISGDSIVISTTIDSRKLPGLNNLYVNFNPNNDQPEQYLFNNFGYKNFYVKPDSLNPLLDVTFDGVHILNKDIVSPKPRILIKLKDEAKWMILSDTSLVTLKVRYPDGSLHNFYFNSMDTLQFTPAGPAPNNDNTASINFFPSFKDDGEYELIVSGQDESNNKAGAFEYRVAFEVINKPMISNMLNYPNPFTTSTAFVFTLTGSEVPQNIKIEIMTVTGKIVREITKDELGPLHIGRNITEFKWDGTDQYGQKLANGIYLYRVVTNLNGKSLDKYKAADDNTDKYFNKGYGKMYLMR